MINLTPDVVEALPEGWDLEEYVAELPRVSERSKSTSVTDVTLSDGRILRLTSAQGSDVEAEVLPAPEEMI